MLAYLDCFSVAAQGVWPSYRDVMISIIGNTGAWAAQVRADADGMRAAIDAYCSMPPQDRYERGFRDQYCAARRYQDAGWRAITDGYWALHRGRT